MRSTIMQGAARPSAAAAPGPARAATAADAENAQLDARLDLAAKKAALRSLEAQGGGPDGAAPLAGVSGPAGGRAATITIEQDGKTIVLENPTDAQLRQVGVGSEQLPDPRMISVLTGSTLVAIVLIVWMVLNHLRRSRNQPAPKHDAEMSARMTRIENAIDSVAVEVERISEGQRFTSRLLAEGAAVPVSAGAPGDGERVRRNGEA